MTVPGDWNDPRFNPFLRRDLAQQNRVSVQQFLNGIPLSVKLAAGVIAYDQYKKRQRNRRGK